MAPKAREGGVKVGRGWGAPGLLVLAGLAHALSLAWPWSGAALWPLQILSLAVLVGLLLSDSGPRPVARAGWLAWVYACAANVGTIWWLFISMHTYGGLAAPLAVGAVLALAAFLALFHALAGALFALLAGGRPRGGPDAPGALKLIAGFGACWTLAELTRGTFLTGFPWGAMGYAHVDGPLVDYAPWIGVYGMGLFAAMSAAAVAVLVYAAVARAGRTAAVAALVLLVALNGPAGPAFTRSTGTMDVALLQGNIPQDEKFVPGTGVLDALRWYGTELNDSQASLVVAPETAIPLLPIDLPEGYWEALWHRFTQPQAAARPQALLSGVPLGNETQGYTNSVVGMAPGLAEPYRYDKHHLVPFGEFIPPLFKWFTQMMNIPLGDFNRGALGQPSLHWQGQRIAPNICYEDLFGEEMAKVFTDAATAPTVLVNVSNIGWFGDSVALDQHLHISRLRAIEFERPMLRATNTGATAIIDHRGRVTAMQPFLTRGVLAGTFDGRDGLTPYARWVSRFGLWPLWGLMGLTVLLAWRPRSRR